MSLFNKHGGGKYADLVMKAIDEKTPSTLPDIKKWITYNCDYNTSCHKKSKQKKSRKKSRSKSRTRSKSRSKKSIYWPIVMVGGRRRKQYN